MRHCHELARYRKEDIFFLNPFFSGELVTTSVNEKSLDDEAVEAYHRLAYQILSRLKASIKQYDGQESLQYTRVRLKDSEVVIVPGTYKIFLIVKQLLLHFIEEKFVVAVIQDPTAA